MFYLFDHLFAGRSSAFNFFLLLFLLFLFFLLLLILFIFICLLFFPLMRLLLIWFSFIIFVNSLLWGYFCFILFIIFVVGSSTLCDSLTWAWYYLFCFALGLAATHLQALGIGLHLFPPLSLVRESPSVVVLSLCILSPVTKPSFTIIKTSMKSFHLFCKSFPFTSLPF